MKTTCLRSVSFVASILLSQVSGAVDITVDESELSAISPYVYGANFVDAYNVDYASRRLGGNRMTAYNWENNLSNAGSDYIHSNDTHMCGGLPTCDTPGLTITDFVDVARSNGSLYELVTLQMAGFVAADGDGTVSEGEAAPSSRWIPVQATKGSAFLSSPELNDGVVYMDELVGLLVDRYGAASDGGVAAYSLDNEPDLWHTTHSRIYSQNVGAAELVELSIELATAVKNVDPSADVFGFASYGFAGYASLQDAADWSTVQGSYHWYVEYFLAQMAAAEQTAGQRLLDVLDLHYYPEAAGNGVRVLDGTAENAGARVQAPRSLWDPTYGYSATDPAVGEDSWICEFAGDDCPIRLIPKVQEYITTHYPGTQFAMTEYDFGAPDHVSGGLAQADTLGILGREGVYMATRWGVTGAYSDAAFKLYLDYDGAGATYGNTAAAATSSDIASVSAYASLEAENPGVLHLVLINRDMSGTQIANIAIASDGPYATSAAWGFDATSAVLSELSVPSVVDNQLTMELTAGAAVHVVLTDGVAKPGGGGGIAGGPGGVVGPTDPGSMTGAGGNSGIETLYPTGATDGEPSGCSCSLPGQTSPRGNGLTAMVLLALLGGLGLLRRKVVLQEKPVFVIEARRSCISSSSADILAP